MTLRVWALLAVSALLLAPAVATGATLATREIAFVGVGEGIGDAKGAEGTCPGALVVAGEAKAYYDALMVGVGPSEPGDRQVSAGPGNFGVPALVDPATRLEASFSFFPDDPRQPGCGPSPTTVVLPLQGSWQTGFRDLAGGGTLLGPYDARNGTAPVTLDVPAFVGLKLRGSVVVAGVEA